MQLALNWIEYHSRIIYSTGHAQIQFVNVKSLVEKPEGVHFVEIHCLLPTDRDGPSDLIAFPTLALPLPLQWFQTRCTFGTYVSYNWGTLVCGANRADLVRGSITGAQLINSLRSLHALEGVRYTPYPESKHGGKFKSGLALETWNLSPKSWSMMHLVAHRWSKNSITYFRGSNFYFLIAN